MKHHLSSLSILHYVYGAFTCLVGVGMLLLVALGHFMDNPDWFAEHGGEAPPPFVGGLLRLIGWAVFLLVESIGVLNIISAGLIQRRKGRVFSQVVAAFDCFNIPFGLALGIFTFVVLGDQQVRLEYGEVPRV